MCTARTPPFLGKTPYDGDDSYVARQIADDGPGRTPPVAIPFAAISPTDEPGPGASPPKGKLTVPSWARTERGQGAAAPGRARSAPTHRPHRALASAAPLSPLPEPLESGRLVDLGLRSRDRLNGILHE